MTNEQPSPDQTGKRIDDWMDLIEVMQRRYPSPYACIDAVIAAYRSQQAAAGIVEVRRDDVQTAIAIIGLATNAYHDDTSTFWDVVRRFDAALAAATEKQQP